MSASEFAASIDWDGAFARLKIFPVSGYSDDEISRLTPRRTYEIWYQLNEINEAIASIGRSSDEAAPERHFEPTPPPEPIDAPVPEKRKMGLDRIGGLGLEDRPHCAQQPGEDQDDPFSVSRDIVRERTIDLINALCDKGMLVSYSVPAGNREAARDFFEKVWSANCAIFDRITLAVKTGGDEGRAVVMNLCEENKLSNYGVEQGDIVAASALYDKLLGYWNKREENVRR